MLCFDESDESISKPDFCLQFGTESRSVVFISDLVFASFAVVNGRFFVKNYVCTLELNKCTMEVDVSFVDRLNNLLFCQPCFKLAKPLVNKYLFEVPNADLVIVFGSDF